MDSIFVSRSVAAGPQETEWKPNASRREVMIEDYGAGSGSPSEEETSEGELPPMPVVPRRASESYWFVKRALNTIKIGNQDTCHGMLLFILSNDVTSEENIRAVLDSNGVEMLLNMMEVKDFRCQLSTIKLMGRITANPLVANAAVDLGIAESATRLLRSYLPEVAASAAQIIANVSGIRRASRCVRKNGGIGTLVVLIDLSKEQLLLPEELMSKKEKQHMEVVLWACKALCALSKYTKNKLLMAKQGIMSHITNILLSGNHLLSEYMVCILESCSNNVSFQAAVESQGLVGCMLEHIERSPNELKMHCARTLGRVCEFRAIVRDIIGFHNGIQIITKVLKDTDVAEDPELIIACMGALWKAAQSLDNARRLRQLGVIELAVQLMMHSATDLCAPCVGLLAECARLPEARLDIATGGGLRAAVMLLIQPDEQILGNAVQAVGECAKSAEGIEMIAELDALGRVWSLLRCRSLSVRLKALCALKYLIRNHPDADHLILSLLGSLKLILDLLENHDLEVVARTCAVVREVSRYPESLAVLSERGVIEALAGTLRLAPLNHVLLRTEASFAIAQACAWKNNARLLGQLGVTYRLTFNFPQRDARLRRATAEALSALSEETRNCVVMQHNGAVRYLLKLMRSCDKRTQLAAGRCIRNLRKLSADAELYTFVR